MMTNEQKEAFFHWIKAFQQELVKDMDFMGKIAAAGPLGLIMAGDIIGTHAAACFLYGQEPVEAAREVIEVANAGWEEAREERLLNMPVAGRPN